MEILGELKVKLTDHAEISITDLYKNEMCGVCGNYDDEIGYADFVGPKQCLYNNFNDLIASWASESDECDLYTLMDMKMDVTDAMKDCEKCPEYVHDPAPEQKGNS